jgi:hypothetical protein
MNTAAWARAMHPQRWRVGGRCRCSLAVARGAAVVVRAVVATPKDSDASAGRRAAGPNAAHQPRTQAEVQNSKSSILFWTTARSAEGAKQRAADTRPEALREDERHAAAKRGTHARCFALSRRGRSCAARLRASRAALAVA